MTRMRTSLTPHDNGVQRVAGEYVFDIRQNEFLMLLFVMQSKFDDRERLAVLGAKIPQHVDHAVVHLTTVFHYLRHRRP